MMQGLASHRVAAYASPQWPTCQCPPALRPRMISATCSAEDEQFKEEKAVIIKEISMLEPLEQDEQF